MTEMGNVLDTFYLNSMYGGEERLARHIVDKYELTQEHDYIPYSEMKRKRAKEMGVKSEKIAIEYVDYLMKLNSINS